MISVGRWVMTKSCMIFCAFCHGPERNPLFFLMSETYRSALSAWDESLFVCKSTWTLISVVPLENLMFGFGPVSPSESHKGGFPKFLPPPKRRPVAFADAWGINFSWTPSAISPFFWAQLEDSEDFFFGFATLKKPWLRKIELPTKAMVTCRYDADIKLLVDLGIVGRDSSVFLHNQVALGASPKVQKVQEGSTSNQSSRSWPSKTWCPKPPHFLALGHTPERANWNIRGPCCTLSARHASHAEFFRSKEEDKGTESVLVVEVLVVVLVVVVVVVHFLTHCLSRVMWKKQRNCFFSFSANAFFE